MYNTDTELLFPSRVIEVLQNERGPEWAELVSQVVAQPEESLAHLAFVLMMTKLDGCNSCSADSFRAMRGCTQCALLNIRRYKGSDRELVQLYEKAKKELERSLKLNQ